MFVQVMVTTMAALALLAGLGALCLAAVHLTRRRVDAAGTVAEHVGLNALVLALIPATLATMGSLWLQLGPMHLVPCFWCWVQRGFVYPQVVVLIAGVALAAKRRLVARISAGLAIVGGLTSVYHMVIERMPSLSTACGVVGGSCSAILVEEFGFVTIPTMAFFVQMLILALVLFVALVPHGQGDD